MVRIVQPPGGLVHSQIGDIFGHSPYYSQAEKYPSAFTDYGYSGNTQDTLMAKIRQQNASVHLNTQSSRFARQSGPEMNDGSYGKPDQMFSQEQDQKQRAAHELQDYLAQQIASKKQMKTYQDSMLKEEERHYTVNQPQYQQTQPIHTGRKRVQNCDTNSTSDQIKQYRSYSTAAVHVQSDPTMDMKQAANMEHRAYLDQQIQYKKQMKMQEEARDREEERQFNEKMYRETHPNHQQQQPAHEVFHPEPVRVGRKRVANHDTNLQSNQVSSNTTNHYSAQQSPMDPQKQAALEHRAYLDQQIQYKKQLKRMEEEKDREEERKYNEKLLMESQQPHQNVNVPQPDTMVRTGRKRVANRDTNETSDHFNNVSRQPATKHQPIDPKQAAILEHRAYLDQQIEQKRQLKLKEEELDRAEERRYNEQIMSRNSPKQPAGYHASSPQSPSRSQHRNDQESSSEEYGHQNSQLPNRVAQESRLMRPQTTVHLGPLIDQIEGSINKLAHSTEQPKASKDTKNKNLSKAKPSTTSAKKGSKGSKTSLKDNQQWSERMKQHATNVKVKVETKKAEQRKPVTKAEAPVMVKKNIRSKEPPPEKVRQVPQKYYEDERSTRETYVTPSKPPSQYQPNLKQSKMAAPMQSSPSRSAALSPEMMDTIYERIQKSVSPTNHQHTATTNNHIHQSHEVNPIKAFVSSQKKPNMVSDPTIIAQLKAFQMTLSSERQDVESQIHQVDHEWETLNHRRN